MSINIFIHGGCATKDAFEHDKDEKFKIVHYCTQSSMATLCFPNVKNHIDIFELKTSFEKKMLEDDCNRSILTYVAEKQFDLLVLDFMDERGGLININNLGYVTNLIELRGCEIIENEKMVEIIEPYSNYHKRLFYAGFNKLYHILKNKNKENLCVINKVFLPVIDEKDTILTDQLVKANNFFKDIYAHIAKHYPSVVFLEYSDEDVAASSDYGLKTPFKYIDNFYQETLRQLENIYNKRSINFIKNNIKYDQGKIIFDAQVNAPYSVEFAAYLFNGDKRVDTIWYQDSPFFEFNILEKGVYKIRFFCRKKGEDIIKSIFSDSLNID